MEIPSSLPQPTVVTSLRFRRRIAATVVAATLSLSGLVVAEPALAQPAPAASTQVAASVATPAASGSVVAQTDIGELIRQIVCPILDRLAERFSNFAIVLDIINSLRARFGCISPG